MQGIRVDPQDFIRNAGKALGLSSGPQPGQVPHQAQQNHLYSNSTNFVGGSSPFASPPPTKAVSAEALEAVVLQQGGKGHHGQGQSNNYSRGGQHPGQHGRGNQSSGQYGQQRGATAPYNPTGQQGGYGAGAGAGAQPYAPQLQQHNQPAQQQQPTANLQQQAQIAAALQQLQQMQLLQNLQQQQQQQAAAAHQGGINLGGSRNDAIANNPIAALASLMSGNMQLLQQQHLQQQAQQSQSQQQSRHPFSQQQSSAQQQSQQVPQGGAHKQAASSQLIGPSGLALNALASPFSSLGPGGAAALFAGTNGHNAHIPAAVQSAFSSNANNGGAPPAPSTSLPPLPPSPHSSVSGQHHPLSYASPAAPPAPTTNPNVTGRVGASGAPPASTSSVPDLSVLTTPPPPVPSAGSTRAAGLKQVVGLSTPTTATGAAPARPVSPPSVTSSRADGLESLPYTAPGATGADADTVKVVLQLKNVETATEKQITQFVQQGFGNIEGLLTACIECEGAWYAIFKDEETAHAAQQNVRNKILADAKPFTKLLTLRQLPKALQRTNNWKSNAAPAENCGIWNRSGTSGRDSPPKFRQTAFPGAPGAPVPGTPVGGAPGQGPQVATPVAPPAPVGEVSGFQQATEAAGATEQPAGTTEGSRAWTATEKGKYKDASQFARLLPVVQIPGPENGAGRGFAAGRGKPVAGQGATGNNLPMSR